MVTVKNYLFLFGQSTKTYWKPRLDKLSSMSAPKIRQFPLRIEAYFHRNATNDRFKRSKFSTELLLLSVLFTYIRSNLGKETKYCCEFKDFAQH